MYSVNQEDLITPKVIPIYLRTRGRMLPWEFAAIELEFSPVLGLTMENCEDNTLCATYRIEFTELVHPSVYGKLRRSNDSATKPQRHNDKYSICARFGFQILLIQQRILAFLAAVARAILHDKTDLELLQSPAQALPVISQTVKGTQIQQTSFTDVLNMAPYQGWNSLNLSRLRGYVESTLTKHKSHIWALREDPGYFADTIREFLNHLPMTVPSDCGCHRTQPERHPEIMMKQIASMLNESYAMVYGWNYLKERLDIFDQLLNEDATKQQQAHSHRATPECRLLFTKACGTETYHRVDDITPEQKQYLDVMKVFRTKSEEETLDLHSLSNLSFGLEMVDHVLQKNKAAQKMATGRILDLLTDLSIIVECARQGSLWERSPDVETGKVSCCSCDIAVKDHESVGFFEWKDALSQDFSPPVELILPLKEKLCYPEHKKRTRNTTTIMFEAERSLDLFWAAIDSHFESKTGLAQHRVIKDCLLDSHKMQRTIPWDDDAVRSVKPVHNIEKGYQPVCSHLHDEALQITGIFDRTSVIDKVKQKTKGTDASDPNISNEASAQLANSATFDEEPSFQVKKQTYKVFRALLHVPSVDAEEVARQVKWTDFIKAMIDIGFAVEKLQGSAWQFVPSTNAGNERKIQFHEPHPANDITPVIASRMGRRLSRVYGWSGDIFTLA